MAEINIIKDEKRLRKIYKNIVKETIKYVNKNGIKSLVTGISGGVDSALVARIAKDVSLATGCRSIGYCIPILSNKPEETIRAISIGKHFCNKFETVNLSNGYMQMLHDIDYQIWSKLVNDGKNSLTLEEKIRAGNIKARIRMVFLYNAAQANKGIVLSTDNLTELNLGFWTLHGDVGDFGPIQQLWKTEVYEVVEKTSRNAITGKAIIGRDALMACVDAVPTDGLGVTNSDIDQLLPNWTIESGSFREAYELVDAILIDYFSNHPNSRTYAEDHPVIQRHKRTEYKRCNPINLSRDLIVDPPPAKVFTL